MKRNLFTVLMSAVLLLSLAGCGSGAASGKAASQSSESSVSANEKAVFSTAPGSGTASVSPGSKSTSSSGHAIVVYFSWSGNTKSVATEIASQTGADLFQIVPKTPYPSDYNTLLNVAQQEQKDKARPAIAGNIKNFDQYSTVFVGFPNWWGDMPMILYTFFDRYELSGKKLVPFVTSGGSGFSNTRSTIADLEPNAAVLDGLALGISEAKAPASAVKRWLTSIGLAS
ncbi:MAG: flavodoxin [Oscillospiraceae bacterium]|nr:flavodoxin [Oscillospiraceae bacterium]